MIWKSDDHNSHQWIGPHRVIIQDGNTTVWTTQAGRLYRRAPEHVRLATPEETMQEVEASPDWTLLERQIQNMSKQDNINIPNHELTETPDDNPNPHSPTPSELPEAEQTPMEHTSSNPESVPQPDQEPENPTEASPSSEQMPTETKQSACIARILKKMYFSHLVRTQRGDVKSKCNWISRSINTNRVLKRHVLFWRPVPRSNEPKSS